MNIDVQVQRNPQTGDGDRWDRNSAEASSQGGKHEQGQLLACENPPDKDECRFVCKPSDYTRAASFR